jgi:eukaryotic-like serine/threonine-protein kinase
MSSGPRKNEDPATETQAVPTPGSRLGHYEIRSRLGAGGMGVVFEAFDPRLNRAVALKVLTSGTLAQARGDLTREAQAASALNHPNIITVYEIGVENDVQYIAMERVEGQSLLDLIGGRPMPLKEALPVAIQIAAALAAAHETGIVHRDLKPGNVMVTPRGLVKVLDFGLAQRRAMGGEDSAVSPTVTIEDPGRAYGTLAYMSPEQARGQTVDARSDVFAFGCVLYEMVTGRRAFHEEDGILTFAAILGKDPRPPRELFPGLPVPLERVIDNCLRKNRLDRWQSMADVKLLLEAATQDLVSATAVAAEVPRTRSGLLYAAGVLAVILAGVVGWQNWPRAAVSRGATVLRRVTADSGLTAFPALSRDGSLLAFASDRGGEENLDLWLQQIGGREPIRLTHDPADDSDPDFSPDSTRIAFRSERGGGGVYVVPPLGGEELLLAPGGQNPRFSPDGRMVAYWEGSERGGYLPDSARVFVVDAGGGQPRRVGADLDAALYPVWSPRSDSLLVLGRMSGGKPLAEALDWWIVNLSGGPSRRTGAFARFSAESLVNPAWQFRILPLEWQGENAERVLFAAGTDDKGNRGDTANLWELELTGAGKAGSIGRLTSGPGYHMQASRSWAEGKSRLSFSSVEWQLGVWSADVDEQGTVRGPIRSITESEWYAGSPAISADGTVLAFLNQRLGRWTLRARDLVSGREAALVTGSPDLARAKISPDGKVIVYATVNGTLFSVPAGGGKVESLCDRCGAVMGVSPNGRSVAYESGHSNGLLLLDAARHAATTLATPPDASTMISGGQYSPDGKWIAFHTVAAGKNATTVWIAPADTGRAVGSSEWTAVTDGSSIERDATWSPRGNLLYFTSERDGYRCIWARRLDDSKRPSGAPFPVLHFHSARRSLRRISARLENNSLSAGGSRLVFAFGELRGNVWLEERTR